MKRSVPCTRGAHLACRSLIPSGCECLCHRTDPGAILSYVRDGVKHCLELAEQLNDDVSGRIRKTLRKELRAILKDIDRSE